MKKLIIGCAALASALALNATVESANTFGILKVESDQEQVIISVPWVSVGTSEDAISPKISPTDLVCTTGLREGDKLYYYDSSDQNYYGWKITDTGTEQAPILVWAPGDVLEGDEFSDPGAKTVDRGAALILVRTGTLTSTSAFYLNGQYISGKARVPIIKGTPEAPKWTFFAPTTAAPVDLATLTPTSGSASRGDKIRCGVDKEFFFDGNKWCHYEKTMVGSVEEITVVEGGVIPAGVAAIYISVGRADGDAPTFSL